MKSPAKVVLVVGLLGVAGALLAFGPRLVASFRSTASAPIKDTEVDTLFLPNEPDFLVDDRTSDKNPTFDPSLVDRRPVGDYQINASGAVIRLDAPVDPSDDVGGRAMLPTYAAAMAQAGSSMLVSINLIDGKAKQFDDGLYAAIDRAYYSGDAALGATIVGHRDLLTRLLGRVAPGSATADYLAAGLSLDAGHPLPGPLSARARQRVDEFRADEFHSKPISFYTWDATLGDCFRVLRFFSLPIEPGIAAELARVLRADPALLGQYRQAISLYARLSNPLDDRSILDLVATPSPSPALKSETPIALFPASTSREVELFRKLFPEGVPPGASLMLALVTAIRSGTVDLAPNDRSGWYEYQAYALEPMLLPDRGAGADHLLLTKGYKKRLLAAFEALLTKRRETHARQRLGLLGSAMPPDTSQLPPISPRLRVEPNPSYYLRTARSYAFVADLLDSTFGTPALETIHGRTATGLRPASLGREVRSMRDLFLGFALLASEDIGHRLELTEAEAAHREAAEAAATAWLAQVAADSASDPDLAADTRVVIPIGINPRTRKVRLWATIGTSVAPLRASYDRPPQVRPATGGDWRPVSSDDLHSTYHDIVVDEFAEIELDAGRVLTRAELRAICDTHKTRDAIRAALGALK